MSSFHHPGRNANLPIDALRGLLILLGILLHAARPYDGTEDWLVADQAGPRWLLDVATGIAFFRMPLFFFLSGLLSWSALVHRSGGVYLGRRIVRLGVPLIFAAIFMNAAVAWLLEGKVAMGQPLTLQYWVNGEWLLHLWFLLYLIIYSAILVVARPLILRLPRFGLSVSAAILLGFLGSDFVAVAVAQVFPGIYGSIGAYGTPYWLIHFGTYFLLGAATCHLLGNFERITQPPMNRALILIGLGFLIWLRLSLPEQGVHVFWEVCRSALNGLLLWCLLHVLIALSMLLARWAPVACKVVADASYSIYLIHHSIVVVLAVAFQSLVTMPAEEKFLIIVVITTALSVASHLLLVQRFRLLRGLINGKWHKKESPSSGGAPVSVAVPRLQASLQRSSLLGDRASRRVLK